MMTSVLHDRGGRWAVRWVVLAAALAGLALLSWGSASPALAACEGACSTEQLVTGMAHPPAWAAGRSVHFEAASNAESAYSEEEEEDEPGPLLYHEGSEGVQHTPKVNVIFWGSNFTNKKTEGPAVRTMLLKLYEGLSGSSYQGILSQYFDPTSRVGSSVSVSSYDDESVEAPQNLYAEAVEEEIMKAISVKSWKAEKTAQFVVVTAPGSTYEGKFIAGACAFHGITTASANVTAGIVYAFVPYQGKPMPEKCVKKGNPTENPVYKTSKSASHEYAEAATNPIPSCRKTSPWNGLKCEEVADKCNELADLELPDGAYAQKLYDDHQHGCSNEDAAPAHAYAITEPVTGMKATGATLEGTANPELLESDYYYEYGKTLSYGTKTAEVNGGSGVKNIKATQAITGLTASSAYDYRLVETNSTGTTYGENMTFDTLEVIGNTELPVISPATPDQGVSASTTNGIWAHTPTSYEYQWEQCNATGLECVNIAGATKSSYTPAEGDVGHTLRVVVTAKTSSGEGTATSAATGKVEAIGQLGEFGPLPEKSYPADITTGPDGNVWLTLEGAAKIVKVTSAGAITEYALPAGSAPWGITPGPAKENALWFTEGGSDKLGKITTAGTITEYTRTAGGYLDQIAAGPDGNLWFTASKSGGSSEVGKITTAGTITEYTLPEGSAPNGIVAGPDGNLWFTEAGKIAKITTSGTVTEYTLPGSMVANNITVGPDGNLWFTATLFNASEVGKITTSGTVTEYALPEKSNPRGIAAGADGNLWFTEYGTSKIGRITTSGTITEYTLTQHPWDITAGPNDELWFTEQTKVGTIAP
jgi:streptogramin lyase